MEDCLFCKIIQGRIKSDTVFKDERAVVIRDINPQAPTHVLILPVEHIPSVADLSPAQEPLMGYLLSVARKIAQQEGVAARGYRLLINAGPEAGQTVAHLHIHLFGGRPLGPMLCRHT